MGAGHAEAAQRFFMTVRRVVLARANPIVMSEARPP